MVENLTRRLPTPEHSVSEKLTFAVRGRVDFSAALDLANKLDAEIRSHTLLKIAAKQNEVGLDSTFALDQAIRYAGRGRHVGMSSWPALVNFYGDLGDFEKADRFRKRIEKPHRLLVDFKLVEAVARAGGDPQARLDAIESRLADTVVKHPPGSALHYCWLAETYHAIGRNPTPTLSKALEIAEKEEGHFSTVAQSFAKIGMFKEAVDVAKKLKRASRGEYYEDKTRTLYEIAKHQVKSGDLEGAIQTVGISRNRYYITSIIASAALFSAENGQIPETLLEEAVGRTREIENDIRVGKEKKIQLQDLATIWTEIALTQGLAGQDYQASFNQAIDRANVVTDTYYRITDLIGIYRAKFKLGQFDTEILLKSLELADKILEEKQHAELAGGFQLLAYEDLAEVAVDTGNFDLATEVINRFPESDYMRAELLAYLGAEMVRRGLTTDEINNLSSEQMLEIYQGNDQATKDALSFLRAS